MGQVEEPTEEPENGFSEMRVEEFTDGRDLVPFEFSGNEDGHDADTDGSEGRGTGTGEVHEAEERVDED